MPLTDDIIRRLARTNPAELDRILARFPQANSPLIRRGGMTALPPGTELLRPRPVLTGPATQATAPTEGFNVGPAPPTEFIGGGRGFNDLTFRQTPEELAENRRRFESGEAPPGTSDLVYRQTPEELQQNRERFERGEPGPGFQLAGNSTPAPSGFMPESLTRPAEPAEDGGVGGMAGGLWDRVKGFFEPDEPLTPEEQYDEDVSGAGWAGAAQAASQAASDYRASPIQVLTAALGGYSVARNRAKGDLKKEARADRLADLQERGLTAEATKLESEAAQRQRILDVIGGIEDPEQRRAALLNPEAFGTQLAKQAFPDPEKLIVVNDGVYDPNSRQFIVKPKGPEPKVFGDSTGGYYTLGPDGIQQLTQGLGREPKEPKVFGDSAGGYYTLGPDGRPQQLTQGLGREGKEPKIFGDSKAGYYTLGPDGQPRKLTEGLGATGADSEPLEAVVTPEGIRLVPRSQAAGMQPAPKQEGGSQDERMDAALVQDANQARADGGFQNFTPERLAIYTRKFLRANEPKYDQAGNIIRPLTQDLPVPPGLAGFDDIAPIATPIPVPAPTPGAPPPDLPMVGVGPGASILPQPPGVPQLPLPGGGPGGGTGAPPGPVVPPMVNPVPGQPPVPVVPADAPPAIPPGIKYPKPGGPEQVTNTAANRTKIAEVRTARAALTEAVNDYKALVAKTGGKLFSGALGGAEAAALNAAQKRVILRAKNVYELGALTGPDLPLMEAMVPNALGIGSFNSLAKVNAGIEQLLKDVDFSVAATEQAYGPPGDRGGSDFTGMSAADADKAFDALLPGATFVDTDGKTKRKE